MIQTIKVHLLEMKHYSHNFSFFKMLVILALVTAFNNKLCAYTTTTNTDLQSVLFSTHSLSDEGESKDAEEFERIDVNLGEEDESLFCNSYFAIFEDNNTISRGRDFSSQYIKNQLFSSARERFYILYCQLKTQL